MKKTDNNFKVSLLLLAVILFLATAYFADSKQILGQNTSAQADTVATTTPVVTQAVSKTLTYKGSTSSNGVFSGVGLAVTLPSNTQTGDLLIAVAGTNGPKSSWSVPSGWTLGVNANSTDTQGITWWWKVASGNEAGTAVTFKSSKYADGGIVVNVYHGQAASPIAAVSGFTTTDNFGNGFVSSAKVSGVVLGTQENAVPLIFASWQPNAATVSWPSGFSFESTASDEYATVAVAESLSSMATTNFPGYSLPISPVEAVVQTLQVLVRVQ